MPQHHAAPQDRARRHWQAGQRLAQTGQWAAAERAFAQAVKLAPRDGLMLLNLARAQLKQGDMLAAGQSAERAFRADPHSHVACALWAHCLGEQKRHAEVVLALRSLPADAPRGQDWHETLGRALQYSGQPKQAIGAYMDALALQLDQPQVHYQLGLCFNELDMKQEAAQCFHTALVLGIGRHEPGVRGLLAYFEREVCNWDSAATDLAALREALHRLPPDGAAPTTPFAHVTLLDQPAEQLLAARMAARELARNVVALPALPRRDPQRRVRIGYLSADFHQHATSILMAEMLEQHDRSRFEVTLFSHGRDDGTPMRRRVMQAGEHFVNLHRVPDREAVQSLRAADIDILVDLKGHTRDNRLALMAARPARVQASFLGFPGSCGADYIDYIVGDPIVTPLDHAPCYSEHIAQLPVCYQPNDRQRARPAPMARADAGLPEAALVLCGFNQPFKISAEVFDAWCALLQRLPRAVLWLLEWNSQVRANVLREAAVRGVDPARIVFAPRRHPAVHMARLGCADIFIDTWPCNAHTTASDALWAGVPVVTYSGLTFASRVAGSLNHAVGLQALCCSTLAQYQACVVALAEDAPRRLALRERLLAGRDSFRLFDSERFTRDIEALYLRMIGRHDQGQAPCALPARDA